MSLQFSLLRLSFCLVVGAGMALAGTLLNPSAAIASERVVLKYSIFQRSLPVQDLTELAETGEASPRLARYLRMAHQDPEKVRQVLTEAISVNPTTLDQALNNPAGALLLDRLSQYVHTPSHETDRAALRSALVSSASNDNQISLIEVMQNYPTRSIEVNGNRLVESYRNIQTVQGQVENFLGRPLGELLEEIK
jgi:hypothetical protein